VKNASGVAPWKVMRAWDEGARKPSSPSGVGAACERVTRREEATTERNFIPNFAFRMDLDEQCVWKNLKGDLL